MKSLKFEALEMQTQNLCKIGEMEMMYKIPAPGDISLPAHLWFRNHRWCSTKQNSWEIVKQPLIIEVQAKETKKKNIKRSYTKLSPNFLQNNYQLASK